MGAETFLDVYDIEIGDEFEARIKEGLAWCDELLALFTPLSKRRAWVFTEMGAAWMQNKRVSAVLYGLTLKDFERASATGAALLSHRHVRDLNEIGSYFRELRLRCTHEH